MWWTRGTAKAPHPPWGPLGPAWVKDAAGQVQTAPSAATASVGAPAVPQPAVAAAQAAWDFIIDTYGNDWSGFVRDVLGAIPDDWQDEFLGAINRGERRISVRAGHGVGKTAGCAWAVVCQGVLRYPQKTIMTAPTEGQLMNALFPEVRIWFAKLPAPISSLFELQSDRIFLKAHKDGSFISAKTSSAERPEAMAGVHCDEGWVMLVCDEASAIPEQVYEAAAGSMSGWNCCTILISNPTRNTGLFYQTHHNLKGSWYTIHISCLNSKRVAPDFVKQIIDTYGEDSNAYRIRVLGEFATSDDDVLIPAEWVDSAMKRDIALSVFESVKWGLDVARFGGDKCVLVKRRGTVVVDIKWWAYCDAMETVGRVMAELRTTNEQPEICVDSIGMGGPVADRLRELGCNVRDVNVSEAPAMNPQAAKLRDELWIRVKDWLGTRAVRLPLHDELRQDLCAPTYNFTSMGRTKVEAKADIKKRLRRSPDFATRSV
jgi:phage terminase large subunit